MDEEARPVSRSRSIMTELVFPTDTNHHGTMFGGTLMKYIDKISAISAMRHCSKPVVTASTDSLDFLAPIRMWEAVELEAFVTSMEVYVVVRAENLFTGDRRVTCTAFSTFVAVDENGKPIIVPSVFPENAAEQKLYDSAQERYEARKKRRAERYSSTD